MCLSLLFYLSNSYCHYTYIYSKSILSYFEHHRDYLLSFHFILDSTSTSTTTAGTTITTTTTSTTTVSTSTTSMTTTTTTAYCANSCSGTYNPTLNASTCSLYCDDGGSYYCRNSSTYCVGKYYSPTGFSFCDPTSVRFTAVCNTITHCCVYDNYFPDYYCLSKASCGFTG